jgi:large subunit ribosomal protein L25
MNQIKLAVEDRPRTGKGAAGRLRKQGRVPGVVYGFEVEPTPVSLDALELYHALHGPAGTNVLLLVDVGGDERLCVARDIQRHPVRGDYVHVDLLSVDTETTIVVEVPVTLVGEADPEGVVGQVLNTVPINVPPLATPNQLELSIEGLVIGDVLRVEDLAGVLPEGASFAIDEQRTVVTVNPPETLDLEDEGEDEDLLTVPGTEGEELPAAESAAEGEGEAAGDGA